MALDEGIFDTAQTNVLNDAMDAILQPYEHSAGKLLDGSQCGDLYSEALSACMIAMESKAPTRTLCKTVRRVGLAIVCIARLHAIKSRKSFLKWQRAAVKRIYIQHLEF